MSSLQGRPFLEFTPEVISSANVEQILALIHITLDQERNFTPAALHQALLDGRAVAWLERLGSS